MSQKIKGKNVGPSPQVQHTLSMVLDPRLIQSSVAYYQHTHTHTHKHKHKHTHTHKTLASKPDTTTSKMSIIILSVFCGFFILGNMLQLFLHTLEYNVLIYLLLFKLPQPCLRKQHILLDVQPRSQYLPFTRFRLQLYAADAGWVHSLLYLSSATTCGRMFQPSHIPLHCSSFQKEGTSH